MQSFKLKNILTLGAMPESEIYRLVLSKFIMLSEIDCAASLGQFGGVVQLTDPRKLLVNLARQDLLRLRCKALLKVPPGNTQK
jgi:hypothetical protein